MAMPAPAAVPQIPQKTPAARRSPLRRLLDALERSNMRQAEREIARYLRNRHQFTDEAEREIERRFLSKS